MPPAAWADWTAGFPQAGLVMRGLGVMCRCFPSPLLPEGWADWTDGFPQAGLVILALEVISRCFP